MGDLPAHSFGNGARASRSRLRDSNRWILVAGRTSGRSDQPKAHHSGSANFQFGYIGAAGARFLAASCHPGDVDLARLQSRPERDRECVRTTSKWIPFRRCLDPTHLPSAFSRRGRTDVFMGGPEFFFSHIGATRCLFQRGNLEQQRFSDWLRRRAGHQRFHSRKSWLSNRLHH